MCPNLQRRTTSTVTISWHYLTRSTSLKYSAKDSCLVINLEMRLGPNVLFFLLLLFLSKFRMHRRCKGVRRNTLWRLAMYIGIPCSMRKFEHLDRCNQSPSILADQAQFVHLKWKVVALAWNSCETLPGARSFDFPYIPVTFRLMT
jgi:hypothetical protein